VMWVAQREKMKFQRRVREAAGLLCIKEFRVSLG
jgi:hypothetical protein